MCLANACVQPFVEEGQPLLQIFPRRELASVVVAWGITISCCVVGAVVGWHMLWS
jgi:hypothetical protein